MSPTQELLRAAKVVLAGLEARIKAADPSHVPVFDGIAELHAAIQKVEATTFPTTSAVGH